ncbi:MAG: NAD(P)/FAD-dependent oxidoreductase [Alsobacter sp.]
MMHPVTRRDVLGLAAAGAATLLAGRARADDVDCVIVGAGAAGIAAARELQRSGRTFRLLEARDRVGGRMFTAEVAGIPFDAGASYIHFAERNPWRDIAGEAGVGTEPDRANGLRFYEGGRPVPEERRRAARGAFSALSAALDALPETAPDIAMSDFAASLGPDYAEPARRIARMSLGEEPERVSLRDYARLWNGDDLLVPTGYGRLAERWAAGLPVSLATPASRIAWDRGIAVDTPRGSVRARTCIVTASTGVLGEGAIRFDPPLPALTQQAIAGLGMGALTKIALAVDGVRGDWPDTGDLIDTAYGGLDIELWPFDRPLLVATLGGDAARALVAQGEPAAAAAITDALAAMLGGAARSRVRAARLAGWAADPWSRGAYSVAAPGEAGARAALAEPVGGRLFFAGEATGGPGEAVAAAMTAGGAVLAGRAAARDVVRRLLSSPD